jgi:hypothetical protein
MSSPVTCHHQIELLSHLHPKTTRKGKPPLIAVLTYFAILVFVGDLNDPVTTPISTFQDGSWVEDFREEKLFSEKLV